MIDDLVRDFHLLSKADSLIGRIWLAVIARRLSLFLFAGLIGLFGLGMANIAAFYALQVSLDPVWAAAVVALGDFAVAAIVVWIARNSQPGPELELALGVRQMAVDSLQADAGELKLVIEGFGQEIRDTRDTIAAILHNPLDAAAEKLLIPAALSLLRGLRSKKHQT